MTLETLSTNRSHGGTQGVYRHASDTTGTDMTFAVFVPDHAPGAKLPVLWYLSGLTCTHANVMEKGEYRAACAQHGIIFIAPDTSPRGEGVPDDPEGAWDFGLGAGFYVDATEAPWAKNYRMRSYIEDELPSVVLRNFPMADMTRQGISGHSMGGHGALTVALRTPDLPTCSSIRERRTASWKISSRRICWSRRARRRGRKPKSACSRAMTTAIISSQPSWPSISAGTPNG